MFILGVAGGSSSGKTAICELVREKLDANELSKVGLIHLESFYKPKLNEGNYNYDHPDAFDFDKLQATLTDLKQGKSVEIPIYDLIERRITKNTRIQHPTEILIIEGILVLYNKHIRDNLDMKVIIIFTWLDICRHRFGYSSFKENSKRC